MHAVDPRFITVLFGNLINLVHDLTYGELPEVVFRVDILHKTIGYCCEWILKSCTSKSKVVPKKNLLNCAWSVLGTFPQSLE